MIDKAADTITNSKHVTVFSGAGISVESGIPPFRGKNGLWNKFDPVFLDINYFHAKPLESWKLIKEIFYDFFGQAEPNLAHKGIGKLEQKDIVKAVITQNIDNLHQLGGSKNVIEFHGTSSKLICEKCSTVYDIENVNLKILPPRCIKCNTVLKPDFVFFGEPIPEPAGSLSYRETEISETFILIGTTGEIMPASTIPYIAKNNGANIIEINIQSSNYTNTITDIFLKGKASEVVSELIKLIL